MNSRDRSRPSNPQVVLITGCSSGFGLLTAARLAAKGCTVVATMRDLKKEGNLISEVNRRGGTVEVLQMDVTDKQSVMRAVERIRMGHGRIDVLVNNAGYGIGGFFEDLTDEEIRAQMETNFFGVQNVTRAVIPLMRQCRRGKIINVSSVAGFSASPSFSAYNASKWALEAFSEGLRYELQFFGIDVLLIEPGTYKTKIFYENAQYARHFDNPDSPYFIWSQHLRRKVMAYVNDCHKDPEEIGIMVEKLIRAKNPPFRNIPDIESQVLYWLRRILPFRVYSAMIRMFFMEGFSKSRSVEADHAPMRSERNSSMSAQVR
ncbi:MAG: SDR family oxidoreductase [Candidatus Omnitrophica bacterium]|nr:SDR family oxidoreductase [Candidatus Omnitrophota bacterium]